MFPSYRLVLRTGPTPGKVYNLDKTELVIGRDLNNDIVINDSEISRRHARLFLQGNNYVIEDLGSTNGTSVNGQKLVGPYILRPGEVITFGEQVSLIIESAQADPNATVVSTAQHGPRPPVAQPIQPIAPPPAYAEPVPPPVAPPAYPQPYAQQQYPPQRPPAQPPAQAFPQPPAYPPYAPAEPAKKKGGFPTWAIILIILVLLIGGGILIIDLTKSWCSVFPFLFPAGVCP
jgi:hypothetical protein